MAASRGLRIGIVATRLGGVDGVALEIASWARVLGDLGHSVHYLTGLLESPCDGARVVPQAYFLHPEVAAIDAHVFGATKSGSVEPEDHAVTEAVRSSIETAAARLRRELYEFVRGCDLELLIAENALALPIHLPLGLAIAQFAEETGIPVIAHQHDLPWERPRFAVSAVDDLVERAFPPPLPNVHQVCINTGQQREIARRTGRAARVIPNTVEVDEVPTLDDLERRLLRAELGVSDSKLLVLQPTRVVQRKGIEHALELVRRLDRPATLVISGSTIDEGPDYGRHIDALAQLLGVEVVWAADRIATVPGARPDGGPVHSLDALFAAADLVTYPSLIEGFGRGLLAALSRRRMVVLNRYPVYDLDIRPRGFKVVEMSGFVSDETVARTRELLDDPVRMAEWTEHNLELVRRFFSTDVLRRELRSMLADIVDARA
jgi:glycosyltransferase involved in cell wall biosynthesis